MANHEGLEGAEAPMENRRGAVADGISETVVGWADADDVQTETVQEHDKDSLEQGGDGRRGLMARLRAEHQAEDILGKFLNNQCNNAGVTRERDQRATLMPSDAESSLRGGTRCPSLRTREL